MKSMSDRDPLEHAVDLFPPPEGSLELLLRKHRSVQRNRRLRAGIVATAVVIAAVIAANTAVRHDGTTPGTDEPMPSSSVLLLPAMDAAPTHELVVAGLDGKVQARVRGLPSDVFAPSLSPDGSTLAFVTAGPTGPQIATIDMDGTGFTLLGGADATNSPVWSPDGSHIAFVGWTGGAQDDWQSGNRDIYLMDADGSNIQRLTTSESDDETPEWSPDGSELVFASNPTTDEFSERVEIWSVSIRGGPPTQLTNNHVWDAEPTWSPDGKRIAYLSFGGAHLWVMDADGSHQHRLVTRSLDLFAPQWSPDGSSIVGLGRQRQDGALRVLLVELATGDVTRVGALAVHSDWNRVRWVSSGTALLVNRTCEGCS